jgi:hypothetical protein
MAANPENKCLSRHLTLTSALVAFQSTRLVKRDLQSHNGPETWFVPQQFDKEDHKRFLVCSFTLYGWTSVG